MLVWKLSGGIEHTE